MVAHHTPKAELESFKTILQTVLFGLMGGTLVCLTFGAATQNLAFFPAMWVFFAMTIFMLIYIATIEISESAFFDGNK